MKPTKHTEGYTSTEIEELLKQYPQIDMEKFNLALMGVTGIIRDGDFITYHDDVEKALRSGLEGRNLRTFDWD